jgi:hypothetical protein
MEEMMGRWIRETRQEYEKAKMNQNALKMIQMIKLEFGLKNLRDSFV